jgi:hypothetical protein
VRLHIGVRMGGTLYINVEIGLALIRFIVLTLASPPYTTLHRAMWYFCLLLLLLLEEGLTGLQFNLDISISSGTAFVCL